MIKEYIASFMALNLAKIENELKRTVDKLDAARKFNTVMVIGSGGSASIASHTVIDLIKVAGMRATALNDPATLTCLSNDYGYEESYAGQIKNQARPYDILIAISSSGASKNILRAVEVAKANRITVITFSGFSDSNPLRKMGNINIYVPSNDYGHVEMAHHIFLHAITDALAKGKGKHHE